MSTALIFSIRLLDGRYHGRIDRGRAPEWPPAPMRLFQAIVGGAAPRWHDPAVRERERSALLWLEAQPPPVIVTPASHDAPPLLTYVPNNNDPSVNERTAKTIAPTVFHDGDRLIEWRYALDENGGDDAAAHAATLARLVRHVTHLGWGIDMAIGHALVGVPVDRPNATRVAHHPAGSAYGGGTLLRVPVPGTLDSLERVHAGKLARFATPGVLTLGNDQPAFRDVAYGQAARREFVAFRFDDEDDEPVGYRTDHVKQLAGRLRRVVADVARANGVDDAIVNGTILGHPKTAPRLSILPLPSIGHRHVDGLVRRVMFAAPIEGAGRLCELLASRLDQQPLDFDGDCPCPPARLVLLPRGDAVTHRYATSARTWASVTPVLLPGHDRRRRDGRAEAIDRACGLVARSLAQAGITTAARFAIDRVPFVAGARHARDYAPRDKLQHLPRFHVRIEFDSDVTGPLAIGAGRHVGFGTLAALRQGE